MFRPLACALLLCCLSGGLQAAPGPQDGVARDMQALMERLFSQDGPGGAVLIAKGERTVVRTARGKANIELAVPLSSDNVFEIASNTKMVTAATAMKLVEEGKISLDDPLAKYLPDFPGAQGISLRQLVSHTAGISDKNIVDPDAAFGRLDHTTAELVARIAQTPPDFAPGTRWAYSNSGFILLGAVIEKVTGLPRHEYWQQRLFKPLGMQHTGYRTSKDILPGRAAGYSTDNPAHVVTNAPYFSITVPGAAGDLMSTVDDMKTWMRALSTGRVVSEASFRQMIEPSAELPGTPARYRYGLGMTLYTVRGQQMVGHTGQINGFASSVTYIPSADTTVVLLTNNDDFDARGTARRIAAIALGQPYREPVGVPMTRQQMQSIVGTYRVNDSVNETLTMRDGKLFAQYGKGKELPLQMTAEGELHLMPDELDYWVPVRDSRGRVTRLDLFEGGDGPPRPLQRIP